MVLKSVAEEFRLIQQMRILASVFISLFGLWIKRQVCIQPTAQRSHSVALPLSTRSSN